LGGAYVLAVMWSGNEAEFTAEMLIHFCGLRNIDKPSVGLFPKLLVCLDCGASQFTVPESESGAE